MGVTTPKKPDEKVKTSEWNALRCDCGGELFATIQKLLWKPGGGSTTTPAGWFCHACGAHVDQAHLIRVMQVRLKRQELKEQEQELADIEGVEASTPPA